MQTTTEHAVEVRISTWGKMSCGDLVVSVPAGAGDTDAIFEAMRPAMTGAVPGGHMAICIDCDRPARARGLCTTHYQARRRHNASLPPTTKLESTVRVDIRVSEETGVEILREAKRTGESIYRVAQRWLAERADQEKQRR